MEPHRVRQRQAEMLGEHLVRSRHKILSALELEPGVRQRRAEGEAAAERFEHDEQGAAAEGRPAQRQFQLEAVFVERWGKCPRDQFLLPGLLAEIVQVFAEGIGQPGERAGQAGAAALRFGKEQRPGGERRWLAGADSL